MNNDSNSNSKSTQEKIRRCDYNTRPPNSPIFFHCHQDAFSAVDLSKHEQHGGAVGNGSHHTLEVDLFDDSHQPDTCTI